MGTSLKDELLGVSPGIPPFRMILPEGWIGVTPDAASRDTLLVQARARLVKEHRPELYGQLRAQVEQSWGDIKRLNAFIVMMAGPDAPDWAYLPASVIGTILESTPEAPVSTIVTLAIREYGGIPLGPSRQIVRWMRESEVTLQAERIGVTTLIYAIPVPGTNRTRAVQFTVPIAHPVDVSKDDDAVQRWIELFDAHIATFAWRRP